ncbi:MAG: ABC transporter ATP-binding protein/permease [Oscillospiraceae bacterium]|jgi:ATP-binding cassette subfamily B protein|nr:ABC transporter ATP-binding protein/permease [Oscillospiraceae bacterium]
MILQVPFDLNTENAFVEGQLCFRDGTIYTDADSLPPVSLPLHTVDKLVQRGGIGCGTLEAERKDGTVVRVCRFSMACVEGIGEFAKAINYYLETGRESEIKPEDINICPKCGRRMFKGMSICFHCVDTRQIWGRFFRMMRRERVLLITSAVLMILYNGIQAIVPKINQWLLDSVLKAGTDVHPVIEFLGRTIAPGWTAAQALTFACLGMMLCYVLGQVILPFSVQAANLITLRSSHRLRQEVYDKIQRFSLPAFEKRTAGDLIKRVTDDTDRISTFMSDMGRACLEKSFMLVMVGAILFTTNWQLALCVVLPVPLSLIIQRRFWGYMHTFFEKAWQTERRETGLLRDILKGIRVVKTFGTEAREVGKFTSAAAAVRDQTRRIEIFWALINPITRFSVIVADVLVMYFGGRAVLAGTMTTGTLLLFILYSAYMYEPLRWMARLPRDVSRCTTSLIKLYEVLDEKQAMYESETPVAPALDGSISFDNVQFGYKSYEPVLKHISLEIQPGEMIGLVGHSGAGKSTMINLVMRLYDADLGAVRFNGVDAKQIDYAYLRENIGAVFQETFLFAGTVMENITYAKPTATAEEVIRAARLANAHEFVMKLPDGYNTVVGEDGHNLSGGERQRIAIARAILKDPKILILDEATSALDPETEGKIQEALERLVKNRTTIAIAHRLSTLRHADRLVVLDKGEIAECGTHRELLQRKGIYYGLVMAQRTMQQARSKKQEA